MKIEEIFLRYPKFFLLRSGFFYECGPGWLPILEDVCKQIQVYLPTMTSAPKESVCPDEEKCDFYFTQIKEKWGMIRIYCSWDTDTIENIIDEAEEKSAFTCEVCGKPGDVRNIRGWLMARCNECAKKEQR